MRVLLIAVLAAVVGALLARGLWRDGEPGDPIQMIVTQVRTQAIIEHERQIAVWYRSCPEVLGVNPQIFVAWPGKLSYELDLADVTIERRGETLVVRAPAIRADEPAIPTDFIDYVSSSPWFNLANEAELVNAEVARASPIARFLTVQFLRRDASLREDFRSELAELIERLAGALAVPVSKVEVEIAEEEAAGASPKLPRLELCPGTTAAVNGIAFAKVEDGYTIPFRFDPNAGGEARPRGVIEGLFPGGAAQR